MDSPYLTFFLECDWMIHALQEFYKFIMRTVDSNPSVARQTSVGYTQGQRTSGFGVPLVNGQYQNNKPNAYRPEPALPIPPSITTPDNNKDSSAVLLCGKAGWILGAILLTTLLTIALLYGLGIIGDKPTSTRVSSKEDMPTPPKSDVKTSTTPTGNNSNIPQGNTSVSSLTKDDKTSTTPNTTPTPLPPIADVPKRIFNPMIPQSYPAPPPPAPVYMGEAKFDIAGNYVPAAEANE